MTLAIYVLRNLSILFRKIGRFLGQVVYFLDQFIVELSKRPLDLPIYWSNKLEMSHGLKIAIIWSDFLLQPLNYFVIIINFALTTLSLSLTK